MTCAVILAAGASDRLRRPKQLLLHRGKMLVAHAIECALSSRCEEVVVVIGANAQLVRKEVEPYPVHVVENDAWSEGKASSIRAAVEFVLKRFQKADAALFLTCDQPHISTHLLDAMIEKFEVAGDAPVACAYAGTVGIPALIPRRWFPALLQLSGDQGARAILEAHRDELLTVEFPEGVVDIDRPADIESLQGYGVNDGRHGLAMQE
ncbi:MAG TPA: nucleotidyltransferase family protein [Candidatus Deferrimicrobium sp.]|nr:nucleotidyltransferase family protein [Candidatus Deferrimicrobium sp.]